MNGPIYQGFTQDQKLTAEDIIRRNARQWGKDPDRAVADFRWEKAETAIPTPAVFITEGSLASGQG